MARVNFEILILSCISHLTYDKLAQIYYLSKEKDACCWKTRNVARFFPDIPESNSCTPSLKIYYSMQTNLWLVKGEKK